MTKFPLWTETPGSTWPTWKGEHSRVGHFVRIDRWSETRNTNIMFSSVFFLKHNHGESPHFRQQIGFLHGLIFFCLISIKLKEKEREGQHCHEIQWTDRSGSRRLTKSVSFNLYIEASPEDTSCREDGQWVCGHALPASVLNGGLPTRPGMALLTLLRLQRLVPTRSINPPPLPTSTSLFRLLVS